jgi:hypothetical protein
MRYALTAPQRARCSSSATCSPTVLGAALGALAVLGACGASTSQVNPDGGTGSGGTPAAATGGSSGAGTGGTSGTGGTPGTGGGVTGTGGGAAGTGGATTGNCPMPATFTHANHDILNVTWPGGLATAGGTGPVHIWSKVTFTANGNTLSATAQACGSVLPSTVLSALVGGGSVQIDIPNAAWDAASMPRFTFTATQTGWNVGSTISYTSNALVGFTADPGSWPTASSGISGRVDADGDGAVGLTAVARTGSGFVIPPVDILMTARADKVYIVTRNSNSVVVTRTSCDQLTSTTTYTNFDNHVVGCHVAGGQDCDTAQATFVDNNRTVYVVSSATVQTKLVPDSATCADVRAALPM